MTALIVFAVIIGIIFAIVVYFLIGTVVFSLLEWSNVKRNIIAGDSYLDAVTSEIDDGFDQVLVTFWPVVLLFFAFYLCINPINNYVTRKVRENASKASNSGDDPL